VQQTELLQRTESSCVGRVLALTCMLGHDFAQQAHIKAHVGATSTASYLCNVLLPGKLVVLLACQTQG
jgi:hypothetical protein